MLSLTHPGIDFFCCLYVNASNTLLDRRDNLPDRLPDRMVWLYCCLIVINRSIFQDHIPAADRKLAHNLPCAICSKNWNPSPIQPFRD